MKYKPRPDLLTFSYKSLTFISYQWPSFVMETINRGMNLSGSCNRLFCFQLLVWLKKLDYN